MSGYSTYNSRTRHPRTAAHFGGGRSRGSRSNNRSRQKQFIHPSKFIKAAVPVAEVSYMPTHGFNDFQVHPTILNNIKAKGYETPSPIQDQAIPYGLAGKDVIGIANTGTGKTAAFAIPLLNKLLADPNAKAIIIAPTRELAEQIEAECISFAKGTNIFGALLIGGSPMGRQLRDLRANPNLVIGTPGRIKDHAERRTLRLERFNIVVLDEVDRMVDMGFINDIRFLLGELSVVRQSLFFSATIDTKIEGLIHSFMQEPVTVSVSTGITSDSVEQGIVEYQTSDEKLAKLHDVLIQDGVVKTLVFEETQRNVDRLHRELNERGFKAEAIHGGKTQGHRQRALRRFRDNEVTILIATDVAARGIDISDITHVINYTTPQSYDDYIHRIGRAGRAGRTGNALTFVSPY
jgi:superfamily II DNA/RNA helicase